jgi:hypothetical protein
MIVGNTKLRNHSGIIEVSNLKASDKILSQNDIYSKVTKIESYVTQLIKVVTKTGKNITVAYNCNILTKDGFLSAWQLMKLNHKSPTLVWDTGIDELYFAAIVKQDKIFKLNVEADYLANGFVIGV